MNRPFLPLNRTISLIIGLIALGLEACATTTTTTTSAQPSGRSGVTSAQLVTIIAGVTTPCLSRTPPRPEDTVRAVPQVFVEALLFELPEGAQLDRQTHQLKSGMRPLDLKFFASPHLIATLDTKATSQFERVYYPPGATPEPGLEFAGMTLLPKAGNLELLVLELDVELRVATQTASASPVSSVHLRNTFAAKDRQTVSMVAAVPGAPKTSVAIIVVPHLIRSEADLRDLFECKMQRATRRP